MADAIEEQLEQLLAEVNDAAPGNSWDLLSLRKSLLEFVLDISDEAERFPETAQRPQWNMVSRDRDPSKAAAFVVFLFTKDDVVIAAGRGERIAIREYGTNEFPSDPLQVIPEASRRFGLSGAPRRFNRANFDEWLASSPG